MTIAHAEELKRQLTDKYVIVDDDVPELRRFVGLTGTVKTVNMSGRALVQFDNDIDISWYDIDPGYLKVIPEPLRTTQAAQSAASTAAPVAAAGSASAPDVTAKAETPAPPPPGSAPSSAPAAGGAKLSALDLIRKQGAAKR